MTTDENAPLNLDPVLIPGMIIPVQTDGAVGGVNYNLLHVNEGGLLVQVQPYLNMESGDWVEVFWGDPSEPVAGELVLSEHVGQKFGLFITPDRIPDGISDVWARVTRSGGGNGGESVPIGILVRSVFPGGTDPAPDLPGHQNLPAPEPELPPGGIIDEEAAKNGVKVTISSYPNMREFDRITFSWGGEFLQHDVTQAEVDAGSLEILVTEATILAAGDSDTLALVYRVRDEVHNMSSDWSLRTIIQVEVGKGLFDAPIIENPDPAADPYDVIDLDVLGDADLLVEVQAPINGLLQIDDVVTLTWIGTTAQGEPVPVELPEQTVARIPVTLKFYIPNADVIRLGRGRCVASYAVTRDGNPAGPSKRTFATFLGEEQRLPKPIVSDAVDGVLDPSLAGTTVVVPGDALEAGNYVRLVWLGTRANGSPLLHEDQRPVSGNEAGKPMSFSIPATAIAPLDGGTLSVYYSVEKSPDLKLESEREHLTVGEARDQLPPPFTRPAAEDGMLDPEDLPAYLQIVIPPWPGMHDEQTVHVFWRASVGLDYYDFIPISAPMVGQEVVFHLDRTHVEANLGAEVEISYRVETPGEVDQVSEPAIFIIDTQEEIDEGPLRIMGARFNPNTWRGPTTPRILSALHDQSLTPMRVAWRYEDSERWTVASEWFDDKPGLKLYARSSSETWECRALNIVGNGIHINGVDGAAFVAIRDEVMDGAEVVVDMVAWGDPNYGGKLEPAQIALENVAEISSTGHAFAARLRNGDVACWGDPKFGGTPATLYGDFIQVRGNKHTFVGRKSNGDLFAWGDSQVVPVPEHVLQHRDYIDLSNASLAFAALRKSGHVVVWGDPDNGGQLRQGQERFDDIIEIMGNLGAFVALRDFGDGRSVIGWGASPHGGLVPEEIARLTNVKRLAATGGATFCILLETGEIKAWPPENPGGDIPEEIARLTNVVEVSATSQAYCARLSSGKVVAWGLEAVGGKLSAEAAGKSNIVQVTGNFGSFAALCNDGTVVAWGRDDTGGDTSAVADRLKDVRAIYANGCSFAALTADGRVVTWGTPGGGGNSSPVQPELTGHVTARRLLSPGETEALAASARAFRRRCR